MDELATAFSYNDPLPIQSVEWIRHEMARKELPPLMMASEMGPLEFISTGIPGLDAKVKGFPVSRVSEIYGLEGVGKTSVTLMAIAAIQKEGKKVLFCDVENALNPERAEYFGVDLTKLYVITETSVERVAEYVLQYVDSFDAIIVDSIAAMTVDTEVDGEMGAANMGVKARMMGQFLRKLTGPLGKSKCAVIFINQVRESLEMFSAKYFTPGGKATPFATSLRIELKSPKGSGKIEKTVKGVKTRVGQKVTAVVTKSKVSKPYEQVEFEIYY